MIEVKNLSFTYPKNSVPAINDISFTINKGEIFGFLGPSGAGKTTTQKILIGILKKYSGSVHIMGKELSRLNSDYYNTIGVSFEIPNMYSKFTALENLNYFRKLYSGETENPHKLLELVGLEKDADTRVSDYSKGMKMRLNFCRSLLNKPDIIFLDEPSSGLDPVNVRNLQDIILAKKSEGKTICITTHDMHVADTLCDRIAFVIDGKIPLIDSPRNLKLQYGKRVVKVEYKEDSSIISEQFEMDNLGGNKQFLNLLNDKYIETIHTKEASLDDIFIKTTGKKLL